LLELRVLTHPPLIAHENIVNLLQLGWEGDAVDISRKWPVLVMEYADLGTLTDYFDREPRLPWSVRKTLCEDVSRGLLALHQCGIVHGDLKLENSLVFSTNEGRSCKVKLSDFGGALLDSDALESIPMATPPWNAPEWKSNRSRSQLISSDVYSLGLLLWRIVLNGNNPFDDRDLFPACLTREEHFTRLDVEKTKDSLFLDKTKQSLVKLGVEIDQELMSNIFSASIRSSEADRDLEHVVNLLGFSSQR
jgi:serine/threonine protein kinase